MDAPETGGSIGNGVSARPGRGQVGVEPDNVIRDCIEGPFRAPESMNKPKATWVVICFPQLGGAGAGEGGVFARVQHLAPRYLTRLQRPAFHHREVPVLLAVLDPRIAARKHAQLENARVLPAWIEGRSPLQALVKMFWSQRRTYLCCLPEFSVELTTTAKVELALGRGSSKNGATGTAGTGYPVCFAQAASREQEWALAGNYP